MMKPCFKSYLFPIIFIAIMISACIPGTPRSKRISLEGDISSGTTNDDTTVNEPEFTHTVSWWSGNYVESFISINENNLNTLYLRGESVHTFIKSLGDQSNIQFCMVASFNDLNSNALKNLRARAIPLTINNFKDNTIERYLRIDLPDSSTNASTCDGSVEILNDKNISLGTTATAAYIPADLCPSCSNILTSTNISLYQIIDAEITSLGLIKKDRLDLTGLGIRIDPKSDFKQTTSTCTNSSCSSIGFNCCLNGQCVIDGQMRPDPSADDLQSALLDVEKNPSKFLNWPSVYYVCSNVIHEETENTDPSIDAIALAKAELEKMKLLYFCLEEGKQDNTDFVAKQVCLPNYDQTSYYDVMTSVWQKCGCKATDPQAPDDPRCPNFGLKAIFDSAGEINQIICTTPAVDLGPAPFQELTIDLNTRSAPHRFFDKDGKGHDDIEKLGSDTVQEGDEFIYLDHSSKTLSAASSFSMNAIMGQMSVNLDQALPAKMIKIEYDQTYIISAVSGSYTPCPQCTTDNWFETFYPHPSTTVAGHGLKAVGYTTSRDSYQNNTTNGNYEDTIFGRACWLPPTMLPLSHQKFGSASLQRTNRLQTQAAYYSNGYQKDWFGFNKGALIASFNGVTWFAVGDGRRIISTSTKLFLAINAPFADLAAPTSLVVSVIVDLGSNVVSDFDYDPAIKLSDPRQNKAASCQFYHTCEVDKDCITKLGWEYTCADTRNFKTKWPLFDIDANEVSNSETESASYSNILQGPQAVSSEMKCIYRGAGAPCKINFKSGLLNTMDEEFLRCAPNFYCAELTGSSDFNDKVVRNLEDDQYFKYGQERNILGRPEIYLGGNSGLSGEIVDNIQHNMQLYTTQTNDVGICRPGKNITSDNFLDQHQSKDKLKRTDYISQISSCDSSAMGDKRAWACPAFQPLENQTEKQGDYIIDSSSLVDRHTQNSCGAESMLEISYLNYDSAFKTIEGEALHETGAMINPIITQDACLRRAGAYCHTDLDCSPGKLHAAETLVGGIAAFGGTEAEFKFWEESLICGQAAIRPSIFDDDSEYDLTQNKCCRAIGSDITMYTEGDPAGGVNNSKLKVSQFPYLQNSGTAPNDGPRSEGRYSRYIAAQSYDNLAAIINTPYAQSPIVSATTNPKHYQWKSLNDSASRTCCGQGWIRKFSNGNHDWTNNNRLKLNIESFSCLNYQSKLPFEKHPAINSANYILDLDKLCVSPGEQGCMQIPLNEAGLNDFSIVGPTEYIPVDPIFLDTSPATDPLDSDGLVQAKSHEVPYQPIAFKYTAPKIPQSDGTPQNFIASSDLTKNRATSFFLPIYIAESNIISVEIIYYYDSKEIITNTFLPAAAVACPDNINLIEDNYREFLLTLLPLNDGFCFSTDEFGRRVFHAIGADANLINPVDADGDGNIDGYDYAGIKITFQSLIDPDPLLPTGAGNASNPGNGLHYISKLARLELLGIPQIFYEPIYCNNERDTLLPDLFLPPGNVDRTDFDNNSYSLLYNQLLNGKELGEIYDPTAAATTEDNPNRRIVYQDKIAHDEIFSSNEFSCCLQLGEKTIDAGLCCSQYAVDATANSSNSSANKICKLPAGVDLHVYFNRFVSGEGGASGKFQDVILADSDFVAETGEPLFNDAVYLKILKLGEVFCESGQVRRGAALGNYDAEPNNGYFQHDTEVEEEDTKYFSIIDSHNDYDQVNDNGSIRFQSGLHWNHHSYCK